jgi:hypothetical protein
MVSWVTSLVEVGNWRVIVSVNEKTPVLGLKIIVSNLKGDIGYLTYS